MATRKGQITEAHLDRNIAAACRRQTRLVRKLKPFVGLLADVIDAALEVEKAVSARQALKGGVK